MKTRWLIHSSLFLAILFFSTDLLAAACSFAISSNSCPITDASGNYQLFYATLCLVQANLTSALAAMYNNITAALSGPIHTLLIIYIALYGYAFLLGLAGAEPKEFVIRIFKLLLVYVLTSNSSQCDFFNYVFNFFTGAMNQFAVFALPPGTATSEIAASQTLFGNLDAIVSTQINNFAFMAAAFIAFLLFGPGFIISIMIGLGAFFMFQALVTVFKTMAMAVVSLTLALLFAPVFLCCLLFEETRDMFMGWLSLIVSYVLQPGIIFFYFMLAGPLMDISFIFKQLCNSQQPCNGIIQAYTYKMSLFGYDGFQIPAYRITPGLSVNSVVNFTLPGGGTSSLSIFLAPLLYIFQWLIVLFVTMEFMEEVPDLASRMSQITYNIHLPRDGLAGLPMMGVSYDGDGNVDFGAEGFMNDYLIKPVKGKLGQLKLGNRFAGGAYETVARLFKSSPSEAEESKEDNQVEREEGNKPNREKPSRRGRGENQEDPPLVNREERDDNRDEPADNRDNPPLINIDDILQNEPPPRAPNREESRDGESENPGRQNQTRNRKRNEEDEDEF